MEFDEVLRGRHSVRSFKTTKKVDYQDVLKIIEAGSLAPLAGNCLCLKYIVATNKDTIRLLAEAAQQTFVEEVDYVIVVCTDRKFLKKMFLNRADMYAMQQAGASIENMLLKTTELGLASCWVGAFTEDIVKRALRLPETLNVEALLPIGYEMGKAKSKQKPDINSMVFFDGYGDDKKFLGGRIRVQRSRT